MKALSSLSPFFLMEKKSPTELVHFISVLGGFRQLDMPMVASELSCPICAQKEFHVIFNDPKIDERRSWLCVNLNCAIYNRENMFKATTTQPASKRAIEWPLFCEINGLGDEFHDIKFEQIEQSQGKVEYLLKFARKPSGIIIMQGKTGTGKSFCSLATCELFTRYNSSCIFITNKQMAQEWQSSFNSPKAADNIQKLKTCALLVIDDFGTAEPTPQFMGFFMDLINSRMQWTNRGTIISTNRSDAEIGNYCAEELADRLWTGQKFEFNDKSRRSKKIL